MCHFYTGKIMRNNAYFQKKLQCLKLSVCSYHVTYTFQSESTLCSCLNVKEIFAGSRCEIWSLSDYMWTRTHSYLVHKQTLSYLVKLAIWPVWLNGWVFLYELSGCGFESSCSRLKLCLDSCFWHSLDSFKISLMINRWGLQKKFNSLITIIADSFVSFFSILFPKSKNSRNILQPYKAG